MVPIFKNVGERSTAESCYPVSLLSALCRIFEKLLNNKLINCHKTCSLFSPSQFGFSFSQPTAQILTVASDKIAEAFNRSRP